MTEPKKCANCACSHALNLATGKAVEGPKPQSDDEVNKVVLGGDPLGLCCRRNGPGAKTVRVQVPVMVRGPVDGQMVPKLDRQNRQIMEERPEMVFGWPPVPPEGICYDGWRQEGSQPGDKPLPESLQLILDKAVSLLDVPRGTLPGDPPADRGN